MSTDGLIQLAIGYTSQSSKISISDMPSIVGRRDQTGESNLRKFDGYLIGMRDHGSNQLL